MTTPPPKPGRVNRAALTTRLTGIRTAAGLSGNALAGRMGVVQSRVWKIEHGSLMPGEDDITAWAEASGVPGAAGELLEMLAQARSEQAFTTALRRKGGPAAYQDQVGEIEKRSARIGEFQVAVIPGLLQTGSYARELMSLPAGLRAWGADEAAIEEAVAARLRRQEILHAPGKRFEFVLAEAALRMLVVSPGTLAGQLGKLLSVNRLPSVELGVISFRQQVPVYTIAGFRVHDDDLIIAESIVGEQHLDAETRRDEVVAYLEAFEALRQAASTGPEAEAIIQRALEDLGQ